MHGHVRRVLTLAVAAVAVWFLLPTQWGGQFTYATVLGNSMEPTIHNGSLIIAKQRPEYVSGMIVAYGKSGGNVMHRLMTHHRGQGWITKGDNNPAVDGWWVTPEEILGEVVLVIPHVATWLRWAAAHPAHMAGFAAVFVAASYLPRGRRVVTPNLRAALAVAVPETPASHTSGYAGAITLTLVVLGLSVVAGAFVLATHAPLWPFQAIVLGTMMASAIGFDSLVRLAEDAREQPEPRRTTIVLGAHSKRAYSPIPADRTVTPGRLPVTVTSPTALRDLARDHRLPVIHRIDPHGRGHDYCLITQHADYVWAPVSTADGWAAPAPGTAHPPIESATP